MPWIEAVKAFDADSLSRLLERATVQLGHIGLLHHLTAPLAHRLGNLWIEGSLRTSHEHFATALIRGFLLNPDGSFDSDFQFKRARSSIQLFVLPQCEKRSVFTFSAVASAPVENACQPGLLKLPTLGGVIHVIDSVLLP